MDKIMILDKNMSIFSDGFEEKFHNNFSLFPITQIITEKL